jgi:hypothetical protein
MDKYWIAGAIAAVGMLAFAPTSSQAAVFARPAALPAMAAAAVVTPVQHWRGGPRFYGGRGGYWHHRPWVRRPYYGRIVAGVALGTIIGVAVVGAVPRRPAPDLCWYWVDPYRTRGYWDYC